MSIEFTPWPVELAERYREKGYWLGKPLTDILYKQCQRQPEAIAIICGDRKFSYHQLDQQSSALAKNLTSVGIKRGDTAIVQLPNIAEFYITFFALLKMGVVPINALFSHNKLELLAYAQQIDPSLIVFSSEHSLLQNNDFLEQLKTHCPRLRNIVVDGGKIQYTNELYTNELKPWLEPINLPLNFEATRSDEVAFFQLSGGSTGTPKLIPRTHDDYYYSVRRSVEICELTQQTRYLCALPAQHNYPLSSPGALGVFYAGGCVILATDPGPTTCFPLIREHKVTMTSLVPSAVALWIQTMRKYEYSLESLRLLQVGGAKLSESVARVIPKFFSCKLQQIFGMAEGLVCYTRLNDDDERIFTTQGRPMSEDDEIRIVDDQGNIQAPGSAGMLIIRGPYTFRGYYKSPEHNAKVFDKEGFYYSGDLAYMTKEGYVCIVGREKDQINRGGEKIASEEIESLLLKHEGVIHSALVSMPDPLMGEKSCAFIVVADPNINTLQLRKYLRGMGIAEYKLPDRFEIIDVMPVTPVGKIDKLLLRKIIRDKLES
ncbi:MULTISPECIES: (2,3-dihydroxybenzoyl)adenylate synthase [Photorhabdus]|uniref:(2,3-dihydroxybenzoyl)adenylate synthase n=1 Tax=Photorhabdus TaxID=29487 RepID=UPI000DCD5890|nr:MULTISPECIES: (2,3-dihydroxybenzoyl)adenylate synthase [Photorhabdus]MCT8341388.1 (2,3-dihydroxybenzoyl)adenylate synthase [Photorhabdus kleinii]RAW98696.1 2,3-dihydroxybenzoate-AMP ligase [Photorhabdus sp. S10-54]RAW98788.1 2,3-dihydroxybenzoate-AMP ligase [Photorhabdus sp. S9-53]RAX02980.1 2,3-dihydroxybenzoate-AMP ligase [Photorhabdus sp. S8-52]